MKIAIIGAGNMGGAIARGLAAKAVADGDASMRIEVTNPSPAKLQALKSEFPAISTGHDNFAAAMGADMIVLAVKPWILPGVLEELKPALDYRHQTIVSVAGGVTLDDLDSMLAKEGDDALPATFYVIPDTAISVGRGMTFISSRRASSATIDAVRCLFSSMGEADVIEERLMGAATALSSCGIAYVYKFVQAYVQAGVQMGFYPAQALRYTNATIDGAIAMLRANGTLPQQEIDRVTTPGGLTIRGVNALEHGAFTSAVIDAILTPLKK